MKHMVTNLNDSNEMVMSSKSTLGNFCFDTFFEELEGELYHTVNSDKQSKLLHSNQIVELNCTLVDHRNDASINSSSCTLLDSTFTNPCTQLTNHNLWTLYFDVSRNTHGLDASCLLIDPCGIRNYLSYHLESKCTNNDAKYEALILGFRKAIDLKVKSIEVFGVSRLVTKQVRNFMLNIFHHLNKHQQEVWNLISKFDSFDIKSIPYTKNSDTIMLIDEAFNLNLDYESIDLNIAIETCRPSIPSIDWINSNNDRYTSNGSMIKEKQHEAFLQALVLDQNSEMQYLLENHFGLRDTFKRTVNESLQQKFRKLYSIPKPTVKMNFNKLLAARMITSIHARRGRAVKLKSIQCQVVVDKFDSYIWRQCIQDYSTRYRDSHNNECPRERIAKPLHSIPIEHSSKSGKLNEIGKIFLDSNKYTLTFTISCMIDDVEAIQSFQNNVSKLMGVFYCLTLKLNSKHSVNYFLPSMQMIIIINNKDWHDRVTYQNSMGIFSWSLVPDKKVRFSSHIYLFSPLLDQLYPRQSFPIQFEIKDLLKMENIGTNHKEYIYVYASDNLCSQINKLVLK
jgi:ribonuclease HI